MMKKFKPFLAPNDEISFKKEDGKLYVGDLPYPLLASYKLDGVRCIFKEGQMITRSLKEVPNKRLQEKFAELKLFTKTEPRLKPILDGEFLAKSLEFNDLSGLIRTFDKDGPEDLFFYMFDMVVEDNYTEYFIDRLKRVEKIGSIFPKLIRVIPQKLVTTPEEVKAYFDEAVGNGCDGLILKNPMGKYKCGRGTLKEGLIYKIKPYRTWDAKIVGVVQATKVIKNVDDMVSRLQDNGHDAIELYKKEENEIIAIYEKEFGSIRKTNELGRSVTSKKKGDRIPIEKACDFVVKYEEKDLKVVIAMTDEEKKEIWKNKESYIGKWIEYKGMLIGAKDLPRHPVFIRFREDKNV